MTEARSVDGHLSPGTKLSISVAAALIVGLLAWVGTSVSGMSVTLGRFEERLGAQSAAIQDLKQVAGNQYTQAQARADQLLLQRDIESVSRRINALEARNGQSQ